MKKVAFCLTSLLLAVPVLAAGPVETFTERAPGVYDAAAAAAAQRQLHQTLVSHELERGLRSPVVVEVTAADLADLEAGRLGERRILAGLVKELEPPVAFALRPEVGAVRFTRGGFVWTAAVSSPGAQALRLRFSGVDLAPGAELYVYNALGEAFGPYTGRGPLASGDFWAHTLVGPEARVQLRYGGPKPRAVAQATRLEVAAAGYLDEKFVYAVTRRPSPFEKAFCSFNEPCVVNASCTSSGAVADAEDAVAYIQYVQGAFIYLCSGGLLTDTDVSTQVPLFLTANHCLSRDKQAQSLEAFFQFTTPCGGECYDPDGVVPRTLGASILSTNKTGDYTLMELAEPAPAGSAFLGWTNTPVAFTDGVDLYRISHPGGAPQAYSEHVVDTSKVTCSSWPRGDWIYSHDVFGATEGGSSGSPVVNGAGQVVGQLSGACGFNVNDPCDADSNATVDGAFASYYDAVSQWLDPNGGSCQQAGGACTVDGDCCSNDCKRNGTCR